MKKCCITVGSHQSKLMARMGLSTVQSSKFVIIRLLFSKFSSLKNYSMLTVFHSVWASYIVTLDQNKNSSEDFTVGEFGLKG